MVANINARLQRTQRGQDEIRKKSHVLTQSERLILALVDGTTPTDRMKRKVRGLAERRFRLVVADLIAKGFIEEAVLPLDRQPEILDATVLAPFVRQDPLDPVTITALTLQPNRSGRAKDESFGISVIHTLGVTGGAVDGEISGVDFYLPLEAPAPGSPAPVFQVASAPNLITANGAELRQETTVRRMKRVRRSRQVQIGYWLLFAGLVCAVLVVVLLRSR